MLGSDIISIVIGSLVLSILHALIPNHWLPILAVSRKENWTLGETTSVTLISGLSHAMSTVIIGLILGLLGAKLAKQLSSFTHVVAPLIVIALGIFYIYQHHRHKHFHVNTVSTSSSKSKIIATLVFAMFLSPCFEIEAYFLLAGAHGWVQVIFLAILYSTVTVIGMVMWVRLNYRGLAKINWHPLEHNAGVVTGATLIASGMISFFLH